MGTTLSAWRRAGCPGPLDGGQADTQDAPGSLCSQGGAWPAWVGGRAQEVHTLSFCPSQTRRDTAPSSSLLTEGSPPPRPRMLRCRPLPAPSPAPPLLLGPPGRVGAACCLLGHRGEPPGQRSPQGRGFPPTPWAEEPPRRRAVVLALDGRTCLTASACMLVSGAWTGVLGDAGSRGRAACCPSAPGRPQGPCLPGGLLSGPPPPTCHVHPPSTTRANT